MQLIVLFAVLGSSLYSSVRSNPVHGGNFISTGPRRALQQITTIPGPEVYQYIVPVTQGESPLTLTVGNLDASNEQCGVTGILGYPGSAVPDRVPGPIIFSLPPSLLGLNINFQSPNGTLALLSNSKTVVIANSTTTGLTQADYYKDSTPTSTGFVTGAVIPYYTPSKPIASQYQSCIVNITFVTASTSPGPAPAKSTPLVLPSG